MKINQHHWADEDRNPKRPPGTHQEGPYQPREQRALARTQRGRSPAQRRWGPKTVQAKWERAERALRASQTESASRPQIPTPRHTPRELVSRVLQR